MQTELDLRDKEAGDGADALKQQVKAANRSRRSYKDFLRRFCVMREEVKLDQLSATRRGSQQICRSRMSTANTAILS